MTPAEIIASANVTDPERFRYEVESKTEFEAKHNRTFWPNGRGQMDIYSFRAMYYSSRGFRVATFKLKAWK